MTHSEYGRVTSLSNLKSHLNPDKSDYTSVLPDEYSIPTSSNSTAGLPEELQVRKANATFVILARNSDLDGVLRSVREVEERFNRQHNYPYVLLNEEPFTPEFKECVILLLQPNAGQLC